MKRNRLGEFGALIAAAAATTAGLAATARFVTRSARETERAHPPAGRFVVVQGVKLHYIERGSDSPIVLLHGNGVNAQDWDVSGVLDGLASDHRVIAFDRPGFGYSERPRNVDWTPVQQAELLHLALTQQDSFGTRRIRMRRRSCDVYSSSRFLCYVLYGLRPAWGAHRSRSFVRRPHLGSSGSCTLCEE